MRKHSTEKEKRAKNRTKEEPIEHSYNWNGLHLTQAIIDRWTEELRKFPEDFPHAKTLTEFMHIKQIYRSTFYALVKKDINFKKAYEHTQFRLGERLWASSVDNKTNWKAVHHRLHTFDQEFKEDDKYHDERAKKRNDSAIKALQGQSLLNDNALKNLHESNK